MLALLLIYLQQAEVPVNWCPALGTVLANEEVINGVSERGGFPVIRKVFMEFFRSSYCFIFFSLFPIYPFLISHMFVFNYLEGTLRVFFIFSARSSARVLFEGMCLKKH